LLTRPLTKALVSYRVRLGLQPILASGLEEGTFLFLWTIRR
jgi:hypothetical protein